MKVVYSLNRGFFLALLITYIRTGAIGRQNAAFGQGIGPIVWSYAVCSGTENRLLDCPRSSTINSCGHQYDVGVECLQRKMIIT